MLESKSRQLEVLSLLRLVQCLSREQSHHFSCPPSKTGTKDSSLKWLRNLRKERKRVDEKAWHPLFQLIRMQFYNEALPLSFYHSNSTSWL